MKLSNTQWRKMVKISFANNKEFSSWKSYSIRILFYKRKHDFTENSIWKVDGRCGEVRYEFSVDSSDIPRTSQYLRKFNFLFAQWKTNFLQRNEKFFTFFAWSTRRENSWRTCLPENNGKEERFFLKLTI